MFDLATAAPLPTDHHGTVRDGAGGIIIDGELVMFDATDWALHDGEVGVVLHPDGRISVETIRDSHWGQPRWRMERKPRLGMIDDPDPPPNAIRSRSGVMILGRVLN